MSGRRPTNEPAFDTAGDGPVGGQMRALGRDGDDSADRQVGRDRQPPRRGAVLGCIPPSRSTCTSTSTFAQLSHGVVLRLGTRFAASTGGTNLLPTGLDRQVRVPSQASPGRLSVQRLQANLALKHPHPNPYASRRPAGKRHKTRACGAHRGLDTVRA
jgi:hypothetical protein